MFSFIFFLSYGVTVSHIIIGLKTTKGTKQLKLDPSIYEGLQKEHVQVGDVIYIEANSGNVKRVGRSDAFATEYDLEAEQYVPVPKGSVHKQKVRKSMLDIRICLFSFFCLKKALILDCFEAKKKENANFEYIFFLLENLQKEKKISLSPHKISQKLGQLFLFFEIFTAEFSRFLVTKNIFFLSPKSD